MNEEIYYRDQEEELYKGIEECVKKCRPNWVICPRPQGGKGFIEDSLFIVRKHKIVWVVILFDGALAFKEFSPEMLEVFSEIIMDAPSIFVEFDKGHRIVEWITHQDKILPK